MAHPLRVRLLELLAVHGTLTASQAAELVDESPANCSFHLRTMAKYGFIEEAEGGTGRERPWRARPVPIQIWTEELDAAGLVADEALSGVMRELASERLRTYQATRSHYPKEWRTAVFESHLLLLLTAEELDALGEAIHALIEPYRERFGNPAKQPEGALPVNFVAFGVPSEPPAEES